jgi:cysteine sulfinate desulfinase/cysteine desulfurase-like protein
LKKDLKKPSYKQLEADLACSQVEASENLAYIVSLRDALDCAADRFHAIQERVNRLDYHFQLMEKAANSEISRLKDDKHRLKCYVDVLLTGLAAAQQAIPPGVIFPARTE